jgi:hypothetical protein
LFASIASLHPPLPECGIADHTPIAPKNKTNPQIVGESEPSGTSTPRKARDGFRADNLFSNPQKPATSIP